MADVIVGQIITAYRKSYYRVTNITRRFVTEGDARSPAMLKAYGPVGTEYSPLVSMIEVARRDFTPVFSKTIHSCDMAWCRPVSVEDIQHIIEFTRVNGQTLIDQIEIQNRRIEQGEI
jgi:hypothetical protein